jgi:Na+/H+ antiporter NhaD/arsenite permease-like protein
MRQTLGRAARCAAMGASVVLSFLPGWAMAAGQAVARPSMVGVPLDFILFALVLLGVALFHHHTLRVAVTGAVVLTLYQALVTGFKAGAGAAGLAGHFGHEWVTLANLLGLLLGFALLADHFEKSRLPEVLPKYLPDDWKGGFVLLLGVFVMSSFLDNIAAAMIGGTMASVLFQRRVHIGYLAAIVAASNAGGAGSVVGDTTTTMIWIAGASPLAVLEAYVGGIVAIGIFGVIASRQQHAYQPIQKDDTPGAKVEYGRVAVVAVILLAAICANVWFNLHDVSVLDRFPVIGSAVMVALLVTAPFRAPTWSLLPGAFKGSVFLLSLVWCASLMPVDHLPSPSWGSTMGLGFLSAVFDNIPLTALAIRQDGYDWGFLAFGVGFGGSMVWFGSSAGVALSNMFPEARSALAWIKGGWHVALGYVAGYLVMVAVVGWHPTPIKQSMGAAATATVPVAAASGVRP